MSSLGWAVVAAATAVVVLLAPAIQDLVDDLTSPSFPDALIAVASLLMLAIASWSLLVALAVTLGASSSLVSAIAPMFLQRALLAGVAGALVITPAHAQQPPQANSSHADSTQSGAAQSGSTRHTVSGLPLPDRPRTSTSSRLPATHTPAPVPVAPEPAATVEVRPGDTLWAIAARSLPSGASDAQIARATVQWHLANRDVIGADPDLIVPRQNLVPPS